MKDVRLDATHKIIEISPGVKFHTVMVSLQNTYRSITPGQTIEFDFMLNYSGVFMYHCGTPLVLEHIASGMFGAVIVEPRAGFPTKANREHVVIQSECYARPDPSKRKVDGTPLYVLDGDRLRAAQPTHTVCHRRHSQRRGGPARLSAGATGATPAPWEAWSRGRPAHRSQRSKTSSLTERIIRARRADGAAGTLYTIEHSTRTTRQLVDLLRAHGVEQVVDVRTISKSRHNPQFNRPALPSAATRTTCRAETSPRASRVLSSSRCGAPRPSCVPRRCRGDVTAH